MKKSHKIIYWVSTIWLALGFMATGILQLTKEEAEGALAPPGVWGIKQLGYPVYFLTIIAVWKILGVIALLVPKFPLLKEWAYAGFFFLMTGAIFTHMATASPLVEFVPSSLLLTLTVLSWCFRPADRKINPVQQ
ncbi:MAG: DoxX family protein [Bacteroidota bacterium]